MKIWILAVAATLLTTTAAHAEMYSGAYVGATAGYERNSVDYAKLFTDGGNPATVDKKSVSGATFGLNVGYDYKVSENFVLGGEFAGTFSTSKNKQLITFTNLGNAQVGIDTKSRATFELTVRAGMLAGQKTLLYVRGGYANSKLKATFTTNVADPVAGNNNGWVAGAGVQYGVSDRISVRGEFRYFDLKGPVSRTQFTGGLAYHF
jgi:outer membrane immunogenic protein